MPPGLPILRNRAAASAMAACTSGCAGLPMCPIDAARSAGPDKYAVDMRHRRDRLEIADGFASLHLQQDADLIIGLLQIALDPAEAAGAPARRHTPHARWRIAAGRDRRCAASAS